MRHFLKLTIVILLLTSISLTGCAAEDEKVVIINPQVMAYPSQPAPSASQEPSQTDTQPQQPSQSEPGTTSPETVVTTLSEAVVPPVPSLITDETDENTEDGISQPAQEPEEKADFDSYFADALFIGDSRSVGLMEYGKIPQTTSFCKTGLSSFNYDDEALDVKGYGKIRFDKLISQGSFKKVYIGLGINELGYDMDAVVTQFENLLAQISTNQPDADIYILANIHVAKKRSVKDKIYNNARIDSLNDELRGLCDGNMVRYIDANALFDDEEGNLRADYTGDNTHLYGKVYPIWSEYIYENSI